MKALSVWAPWAQFIIYGIPQFESVAVGDGSNSVRPKGKAYFKDVDNRPWKLPKGFTLPQRIYIQAGKREDSTEKVLDLCCGKFGLPLLVVMSMISPRLGRGVLLGTVEIVDCITDSKSPWAIPGQNHFILHDPIPFNEPVPCRGQQRFFEPEVECTRCHKEKAEWIFNADEAYCKLCWEAKCSEEWWEKCAPYL